MGLQVGGFDHHSLFFAVFGSQTCHHPGEDALIAPTLPTVTPVLTLEGVPEAFEAGDVFSLTFTFSENVIGFEAGDIGVTGGTLS
ncbi:Ig-like domain-containing protein, partial [[Roseibacterium] beibuensis]|uniref:Ig-like domain-containing protein n=1 Tax=[Roseibacterium] beibuensis TaxID=1193142 RepID=UPI0028780198